MHRNLFVVALALMALFVATTEGRIAIGIKDKKPPAPPAPPVPEPIKIIGTIKHIDLEGGFFGLIGDDKKNYLPLNLAKDFQKDGLRVEVTGLPRADVITTAQWGTPLEIKSIKKSEEKKKEDKLNATAAAR